jgi:hypothetical protein
MDALELAGMCHILPIIDEHVWLLCDLGAFSGRMVFNFIPSGLLTIPFTKYLMSRAFRFTIFFGLSQPARLPTVYAAHRRRLSRAFPFEF